MKTRCNGAVWRCDSPLACYALLRHGILLRVECYSKRKCRASVVYGTRRPFMDERMTTGMRAAQAWACREARKNA
jgi:hypothetical protein